ncbi:uncharacterized protein V6R79_004065 [Siganus canaliculatus]
MKLQTDLTDGDIIYRHRRRRRRRLERRQDAFSAGRIIRQRSRQSSTVLHSR